MKHRILAVLTAAVLLLLFCAPVFGFASDVASDEENVLLAAPADEDTLLIAPAGGASRLVDNADLLTEEEENLLLARLDEVSQRQQFDVVIVTASSIDGKSPMAYADDFFDYNG